MTQPDAAVQAARGDRVQNTHSLFIYYNNLVFLYKYTIY